MDTGDADTGDADTGDADTRLWESLQLRQMRRWVWWWGKWTLIWKQTPPLTTRNLII